MSYNCIYLLFCLSRGIFHLTFVKFDLNPIKVRTIYFVVIASVACRLCFLVTKIGKYTYYGARETFFILLVPNSQNSVFGPALNHRIHFFKRRVASVALVCQFMKIFNAF